MTLPTTEAAWKARASHFLKAAMDQSGCSYRLLAKLLHQYGFDDTEASVTMKLKRGSFSAAWLFACLAALGLKIETIHGLSIANWNADLPHPRRRTFVDGLFEAPPEDLNE